MRTTGIDGISLVVGHPFSLPWTGHLASKAQVSHPPQMPLNVET